MFVPLSIAGMMLIVLPAIFLHLRKRRRAHLPLDLINRSALTATPLTPEGFIIARGQLLPARTADASHLEANVRVVVINAVSNVIVVSRH